VRKYGRDGGVNVLRIYHPRAIELFDCIPCVIDV